MSLLTTLLILLGAIAFSPAALAQTQDDSSRQIVLDRFNKARPTKNVSGGTTTSGARRPRRPNAAALRPRYRRTSSIAKSPVGNSEEIGITIWRLRPARPTETGARVLVQEGMKTAEWTAERIEADTPLKLGDRVRISVESPRPGYLYIIDREQYADGSFGDPVLIFPTLRTRNGDNRVEPGKLIDIPAQEDHYSYFTAQPGGERRDQVAEMLTFILTRDPLPLAITERPLQLANAELAGWERLWGGATERLELVGGAGRTWTHEEKQAGSARGLRLDPSAPSPQSVFRVAKKNGSPLLITLPLRYRGRN